MITSISLSELLSLNDIIIACRVEYLRMTFIIYVAQGFILKHVLMSPSISLLYRRDIVLNICSNCSENR